MNDNNKKRMALTAMAAIAILAGALGATACGDDEDAAPTTAATEPAPTQGATETTEGITVAEAWAGKSPMSTGGMGNGGTGGGGMQQAGERGAAYMIIRNGGDTEDALVGASSDVAETTEVHESRMEGETVTMQKVDRIPVPAEGTVELKPGGYHVMFIGLTRDLVAGETVEITLHFEQSADVVVVAEVRDA